MEYWEITRNRANATLPVWQTHVPALKVNGLGAGDLDTLTGQFEAKAQLRSEAQDDYDEASRAVGASLLKMKILGTKVPQIIDGQLSGNPAIDGGLERVFREAPRSQSGILARARVLKLVWETANELLAAAVPALPPITRAIQGVAQTAATLDAMEDGFEALLKTAAEKVKVLDSRRNELRALNRQVDVLAKNFYQIVKATYDPGDPAYDALDTIPVAAGQPGPESVDIAELNQGGPGGLNVLVSYEPGGGDHATTQVVEHMIEGVDADFGNAATLDPSGNTLGPFTVGQVVKVRTVAGNSTGTVTSAVRTITIETPI